MGELIEIGVFAKRKRVNVPKAKDPLKEKFDAVYIARTKEARKASPLSQEEVATALGIKQDRYKNYETKTPLPLYMLEQFCIIVREDPYYIMFGKRRERPVPITKFPFKSA